MKITFEVDDNFVEYYLDLGWSKKEISKHCKGFIEQVVLEEGEEDLEFMTKFDNYLENLVEEE